MGQTTASIRRRLLNHLSTSDSGDPLLVYKWIRKHGRLNIVATEMAQASSRAELDRAEVDAIELHGTLVTTGGLNLVVGGRGKSGWTTSESTRALISASVRKIQQERGHPRKGAVLSAETRQKIREKATGRKQSSEQILARVSKTRGDSHASARINSMIALDIAKRHLSGEPTNSIAGDLGLSRDIVYRIVRGKTWKHVTGL